MILKTTPPPTETKVTVITVDDWGNLHSYYKFWKDLAGRSNLTRLTLNWNNKGILDSKLKLDADNIFRTYDRSIGINKCHNLKHLEVNLNDNPITDLRGFLAELWNQTNLESITLKLRVSGSGIGQKSIDHLATLWFQIPNPSNPGNFLEVKRFQGLQNLNIDITGNTIQFTTEQKQKIRQWYKGVNITINGVIMPKDDQHITFEDNPHDFTLVDIGFGGKRARTEQYQLIDDPMGGDMSLNLPTATVFHPYDPTDDVAGYLKPSYSLNLRAEYNDGLAPADINTHLQNLGITRANTTFFLEVQDKPWKGGLSGPKRMNFRPHYWLDPDAPTQQEKYNKFFEAQVGLFGNKDLQLEGQIDGNLIKVDFSTHTDAGAGNVIVSSSNGPCIDGWDPNRSDVVYSLTIHDNQAAVVKHIILNAKDQALFDNILKASNNFNDIRAGVHGMVGGLPEPIANAFDLM